MTGSASLPVTRVLAIAPTPFFGDRGCHVRILEEIRVLRSLGIETEVATYAAGNDVPGVRTHRSPALPGVSPNPLGPSWNRPVLDGLLLATAASAVKRFRPQVLHAHLHEGVFIGDLIRRATGLPLVADLQGSLTEELVNHGFIRRERFPARVSRGVERWLAGRPDVVLVSSGAASGLVGDTNPASGRVRALPDGVNLSVFRRVPRDQELVRRFGLAGKCVVVFLGVLTEYQGVDALLEAVPLLARRVPDVHVLVMGYPNEERYRAQVRERGLEHLVSLPGRIPYQDAARWLALGDVAVSAKQSLTEANGKLLNYMACGLPVVATDTPVNRELLGPDGVFAPVGDIAALASALANLLTSPSRRLLLGETMRARAEADFSWPVIGRRLAAIYHEIVARRAKKAA